MCFVFPRFVSVGTFHALVHSKTVFLLETRHQSGPISFFRSFDHQSTAWMEPDSWTLPAYTKPGLMFTAMFVFLPDILSCPWFVVGDQICLLYFAQSESKPGKYVTLVSEECAFKRSTCCLGYFSLSLFFFSCSGSTGPVRGESDAPLIVFVWEQLLGRSL